MKKLILALQNSLSGLFCIIKERAFAEELLLCAVTLTSLVFIDISCLKKVYIVSALFIILITESINSAIETTIDRISEDKHPLSKKAKDIASFAVMLSLLHFVIIYITFVVF